MISARAGTTSAGNLASQPMKISEILTPERVVVDLRCPDKPGLLKEIARRAAKDAQIESGVILDALITREQLGSTGMGAGIAIPHARLASISEPIGLFARLKPALDFDAVDGQRVDLVFLLLLPARAHGDHLNALAAIARRLRDERTVVAMRAARDGQELYALLTSGDPHGLHRSAS